MRKFPVGKGGYVLLAVTIISIFIHRMLLLHFESSRLLETVMTNGINYDAIINGVLFFAFRIFVLVFLPCLLSSYTCYILLIRLAKK